MTFPARRTPAREQLPLDLGTTTILPLPMRSRPPGITSGRTISPGRSFGMYTIEANAEDMDGRPYVAGAAEEFGPGAHYLNVWGFEWDTLAITAPDGKRHELAAGWYLWPADQTPPPAPEPPRPSPRSLAVAAVGYHGPAIHRRPAGTTHSLARVHARNSQGGHAAIPGSTPCLACWAPVGCIRCHVNTPSKCRDLIVAQRAVRIATALYALD